MCLMSCPQLFYYYEFILIRVRVIYLIFVESVEIGGLIGTIMIPKQCKTNYTWITIVKIEENDFKIIENYYLMSKWLWKLW